MLAANMETHYKKPSPLAGEVAVSLIHCGKSRHKVLISGSEQGLRSLAQLLRRLAAREG